MEDDMPARSSTNREPPARADRALPAAYSIDEFCRAHRISTSMFFKLKSQGLGPAEMAVGTRRLISVEAAAAWRRARETAAAEQS
jgi:hypothetical protein